MKVPVKKKKDAKPTSPRVLLLDIETAPIEAYVWGTFDQNVSLNQIKEDWCVLSWAAKWLGEKDVMYVDQRHSKNVRDDKKIIKQIWQLLDEADIVITQNGKSFDIKKLNARFIIHGLPPPASFRQIDTKVLAKKHFGFTSHKLEYMTDKLCTKYKKLKHNNFPGMSLWSECLAGNPKAWNEMEEYNKYDILSLEELYNKLAAWDSSINFNVFHDDAAHRCNCGSSSFRNKGYAYTQTGKFRRFLCLSCGKETRGRENLLTKEKKRSLKLD